MAAPIVLGLAFVVASVVFDSCRASPVTVCGAIREQALVECTDAFYDRYYRGGENGRESNWQRMKDGDRCQKFGADIYSFCSRCFRRESAFSAWGTGTPLCDDRDDR
jgi:hypothetical protein